MKTSHLLETEKAIAFVKKMFTKKLLKKLKLFPVSSPIAIIDGTGINDDLNGIERPVRFPIKSIDSQQAVIVQSLAKWKRLRLKELQIEPGKGILTDMRALRPDETLSSIHSVYVDQWDWEKHILADDRTVVFLKKTVNKIYKALVETEKLVYRKYKHIVPVLPRKIRFIHAEELLKMYPGKTAHERENLAAKKFGAVFIIGIGSRLSNGEAHDGRAPDYDDWISKNGSPFPGLNGDIILWNPVLKQAFEISSMGIRVDAGSLIRQLEEKGCPERKNLLFHSKLLKGELPQSIGGGIGQSRVCMFILRKKHIGEVQVGIWPEQLKVELRNKHICLA